MSRIGVVVFPGSNCDLDAIHVIKSVMKCEAVPLWHKDHVFSLDAVILPGGFSYGDYLRPGAIASHSPIMHAVKIFAENGGPVIGICNGFQILTESGLLPGILLRNTSTRFISKSSVLQTKTTRTPFTINLEKNQTICLPIAHKDGNFQTDSATLEELQVHDQIVFTYEDNPNGSIQNIAGICNRKGNVVGMMPHPERAISDFTGSSDGITIFHSLLHHLEVTK